MPVSPPAWWSPLAGQWVMGRGCTVRHLVKVDPCRKNASGKLLRLVETTCERPKTVQIVPSDLGTGPRCMFCEKAV
jgi:hypothetical protein